MKCFWLICVSTIPMQAYAIENSSTPAQTSLEKIETTVDKETSNKDLKDNKNTDANKENATNNVVGNKGFTASDENKTYDLSQRKMREVFSITLNKYWIISGMATILKDNDALIEIRYFDPDVLSAIKPEKYKTIDGKKYLAISANQIDKYDEENLIIEATLPPDYYHPNKISLDNTKKLKGEPVSAFYFNYSLTGNPNDFQNSMGAAIDINYANKNNWLIKNAFSWDREQKQLIRNSSTFIKEFANKHQIILGDTAGSGFNDFTSVNFFGARYTSPYYTNRSYNENVIPTMNVNGYSVNPGKLDIFLNDKLFQTTNVATGQYNITIPKLESTGAGILKAVTYDKSGKPIIVEMPFFSDSSILKKGAFEYDISAGLLQDTYKTGHFNYSKDPIFNGLVTYGVTDNYTQDLYLTASKYYSALGGNTNFVVSPEFGKISLQWGINDQAQSYGSFQMNKTLGKYTSLGIKYSRALSGKEFCFGYTNTCMKDNLSLFGSLNLPNNMGSFNLNYMTQESSNSNNSYVSLQYNKQITQNLSLSASIGQNKNSFTNQNNKSVFFGLNYSFGSGSSSINAQSNGDTTKYQSNLTFNESRDKPWLGYGNITHNRSGNTNNTTAFYGANLNKFSYGINASQSGNNTEFSGNISGGMYYVPGDNKFGLSKNITSGLAVVEVKNSTAPVGIEHENKLSGFTDKTGFYVVPNITPHNEETISIDINKLPENMIVNEFTKSYLVPANGAVRLTFSARPYPYLVRIYGLETGTLLNVLEDYYVVGEKGRTTIEQEGIAKVEYKPGQFCELDFKRTQKEYYCGDATPENKFPHLKSQEEQEKSREDFMKKKEEEKEKLTIQPVNNERKDF